MPSELFVEVCTIDDLKPHDNADRLEIATVKGWQCIVQKDTYSIGDKVIYFPIDSVLSPETEEKIFGPESKVKLKDSRVRTIKLRGVISQGLTAPISLFEMSPETPIGTDVKEMLRVHKYEAHVKKPNIMSGKPTSKRSGNVNFGKYTKINHIKNFPYHLDGKRVVAHEKIHGTNFRCGMVTKAPHTLWQKIKAWFTKGDREFVYGSHNVQLKKASKKQGFYPTNVYWKTVDNYDLQRVTEYLANRVGNDVIIYGEIYGDGIQKKYSYGCKKGEQKLVVFDIKVGGKYLGYDDLRCWCSVLGLEMPPELFDGDYDPERLMELNTGNSVMVPEQKIIEGLVIRTLDEDRQIFKLINPEYLLKDNTEFS